MAKHIGKVVQVIGPVVDVRFDGGADLPNIYDALHITRADGSILILETQQLTGEDTVRAVSMDSTDGLARGTEVEGMGQPISMPVGDGVKGRLFNVVGALTIVSTTRCAKFACVMLTLAVIFVPPAVVAVNDASSIV